MRNRMLSLFCCWFLCAPVFAAGPCDNFLLPRLGIGVLGRTLFGFPVLGVGPYVGVHHHDLIQIMSDRHFVVRLEWLGELRYAIDKGKPVIYEVNETSGHFMDGGSTIPMENNARSIPERWRANRFRANSYDDTRPHLDQTLNAVTGNVRHEILNTLTKLGSFLKIMGSPTFSISRKAGFIRHMRYEEYQSIQMMRWILHNLIQERAVSPLEVRELSQFLKDIYRRDLTADLDDENYRAELFKEIELVTATLFGNSRLRRIQIVADYWSY